MKKKLYSLLLIFSLFFLSACGGDSNSASSPFISGVFIDDPVEGLSYKCSSGRSGLTDENGKYVCLVGDEVEFFIGELFIGSIEAQSEPITPYMLFPTNTTAAINLARLLQTLDNKSRDGVIVLGDSFVEVLPKELDFGDDDFETIVEEKLNTILVTKEEAKDRMDSNLIGLDLDIPDEVIEDVVNEDENNSLDVNTVPIAEAGDNQSVDRGSTVTLDGSRSSDADNDTLTYSWSITSKPQNSNATLLDATKVNPTFVADVDGSYVISLVVNDSDVNSAADTVTIEVQNYESEIEINKYNFNSTTQDWSYFYNGACNVDHSTTEYNSTAGSIYITGRSNNYDGPMIDITSLIEADKLYVIRGVVKRATDNNDTYILNTKISSSQAVYKELSRVLVDNDEWHKFKAYVIYTQDEIDDGVSIYVNSSSRTDDFYLDDVEIVSTAYDYTVDSSDEILQISADKIVDKNGDEVFIKGINIVAYDDDQSESAEDFMNYTYFNIDKSDMYKIKDMGFNAIRISLWYKYFEDDLNPNVYKTIGDQWLDTMIGWAKEAGLYVMLDMHAPQGGGFQGPGSDNDFWHDATYITRYKNLWKHIATRYKNESTIYAYDLLNEPSPPDEADYRTLMDETISAIREVDTNHILNVEVSFASSGAGAGEPFEIAQQQNIIYDFHFYDPWSGFTDNNTKVYGTDLNKSDIEPLFTDYSDFYTTKNLPFVVSEFGQKYEPFTAKNSMEWVNDVKELIELHGNGYFYFSYKGNEFSIYENKNKYSENISYNQELVDSFKAQ